jgi:hypothetical protein
MLATHSKHQRTHTTNTLAFKDFLPTMGGQMQLGGSVFGLGMGYGTIAGAILQVGGIPTALAMAVNWQLPWQSGLSAYDLCR